MSKIKIITIVAIILFILGSIISFIILAVNGSDTTKALIISLLFGLELSVPMFLCLWFDNHVMKYIKTEKKQEMMKTIRFVLIFLILYAWNTGIIYIIKIKFGGLQ